MKIYIASLIGNIYWNIHRDDPPILNLKSLPEYFFINPLIYSEIVELSSKSFKKELNFENILVLNDSVLVLTEFFVFGTLPEDFDSASISFAIEDAKTFRTEKKKVSSNMPDLLPTYIERFSSNLRITSKQVTVPTRCCVVSIDELLELPELTFPKAKDSKVAVPKYALDTAVTWNNLADADFEFLTPNISVFEKLLLDAIHAYKEEDYRRALLYTAISVETLAATKLDEAHDLITQNGDPDGILRLVNFSQKGGDFSD